MTEVANFISSLCVFHKILFFSRLNFSNIPVDGIKLCHGIETFAKDFRIPSISHHPHEHGQSNVIILK